MTATSLPPDWRPSEDEITYGINLGFSAGEVWEMGEDMRRWTRQESHRSITKKSDWHATFQGWMRREALKRRKRERAYEKSFAQLADELRGRK